MYLQLTKLLEEWSLYNEEKVNLPSRISDSELISIARSVDITLTEMRSVEGEFSEVTQEQQEKIDEVYDFLKLRALKC